MSAITLSNAIDGKLRLICYSFSTENGNLLAHVRKFENETPEDKEKSLQQLTEIIKLQNEKNDKTCC